MLGGGMQRGHSGVILGSTWVILGSTWAILGSSWGQLGPSWGQLAPRYLGEAGGGDCAVDRRAGPHTHTTSSLFSSTRYQVERE